MSKSQPPEIAMPDDEWAEAIQNLVGFVETLIEIDRKSKVPNE